MNYREYISSWAWRLRRKEHIAARGVFDEAGQIQCEKCKAFANPRRIDVHHRTYERLGDELPEDLDILCDGCHDATHGGASPWWLEGSDSLPPTLGNALDDAMKRIEERIKKRR